MFSNFIFINKKEKKLKDIYKNTTIKLLYSTRFLFYYFTIVQEKSFSIYIFKTDFFNQLKKK